LLLARCWTLISTASALTAWTSGQPSSPVAELYGSDSGLSCLCLRKADAEMLLYLYMEPGDVGHAKIRIADSFSTHLRAHCDVALYR
jgi:hypothetical protein